MIFFYLTATAAALLLLRRNRDMLAPIVIAFAIIGCGPGIEGRYLLDELGIAISVAFAAMSSPREFLRKLKAFMQSATLLDFVFFAFAAYFAIQSLRTFLVLSQPSALIYCAYFVYVAGVYAVLRADLNQKSPEQPYELAYGLHRYKFRMLDVIAVAITAYNVLYVTQGLVAELFAWFDGVHGELPARFASQGISWSGSAYAVLPNVLGIALTPALLLRRPALSAVWLASLVGVALIYDSRIALALAVAAVLIALLVQFRSIWRPVTVVVALGALLGFAVVGDINKIEKTARDLVAGLLFLVSPRIEDRIDAGDYDRYAHFRAGFLAIEADAKTLLFGHGMMMHRLVIGEHIVKVFMENPAYRKLYLDAKQKETSSATTIAQPPDPQRNSLFVRGSRSTSFTSMLVDGGLIGILLMYSCIASTLFLTVRAWTRRAIPWQSALSVAAATALIMGWPTVIFLGHHDVLAAHDAVGGGNDLRSIPRASVENVITSDNGQALVICSRLPTIDGLCSRLRSIAPWCLAFGLSAGTFSIPMLSGLSPAADLLAQPRYAFLFLALTIGACTRNRTRLGPETATIAVLLIAYAAYAITRTWTLTAALPAWDAIEPIGMTILAILATVVVVDTPQQAERFGVALTTILVCVAISFMGIKAYAPSIPSIHTFYGSRAFFVGAVVLIFALSRVGAYPLTSAIYAVGAVLLLYAGLMGAMRASLVFYALAFSVSVILLLAARKFQPIAAIILIATAAYSIHFTVNSTAVKEKVSAYSLVRSESVRPHSDNTACNARMVATLGHPQRPYVDDYSCQLDFTIFDVDARLRLLLQALRTNVSPPLGSGLGAFQFAEASRAASEVVVYRHPHNLLAEIYHATGLTGLLLISGAVVAAMALTLRASLLSFRPLGVLSAIPLFAGMSGLVGGDLYDSRALWIAPVVMTVLAEATLHRGSR